MNSDDQPSSAPESGAAALNSGPPSFYKAWGKRGFDLAVAISLLAFLWPVILVVWLTILLLDGAPAFYRQQRVGQHRQIFDIIKFRTMTQGAEKTGTVTIADDARITPVGAWLRRTRFDELPQLWNVVRGDMSFVGPRPDVAGYADKLTGPDRAILELRPGITGPAALRFANEGDLLARAADPIAYNDQVIWPEKVRINLDYARNVSLFGDMGWMVRTVLKVGGVTADDMEE